MGHLGSLAKSSGLGRSCLLAATIQNVELATARSGESELEDRSGQRVSQPTISCSPDASSPRLLPVTASKHRQLVDFHCACLPRSLPVPLSLSFASKTQALSACWGRGGGISISEPGGTFSVSENNPTSSGAALESNAKLNSHQVNGYNLHPFIHGSLLLLS